LDKVFKKSYIECMKGNNTLALTPPMGWNSWDCYAAAVNEEQLLRNAEYMRKHLLAFGWRYIVCDAQWYDPEPSATEPSVRAFAPLCMDEFSRLVPAERRFPSSAGDKGFGPIAAKIHDMGLLFGIHSMRGIPRQAAHSRTRIKNSAVSAEHIADPFSICKWNADMYGVDASKDGAQEYYDSLFELYAAWGVDYVKVDDICNTNMYPDQPYSAKPEIELIRRAADRCGRPMIISLSPGPAPVDQAWHLAEHADMWRIADDFWDNWPALKDMFRRCEVWQSHVGPSCWPDCDMLPLGHIGMGFQKPRFSGLSKDEQISMMTLWCMFRSPLMMGGELNDNDAWTLSLLTNREALAVSQHGGAPRQIERTEDEAIWTNRTGDGAVYLALFNLSDDPRTVSCSLAALHVEKALVRNVWTQADEGAAENALSARLPPHGARLYRLS
jgi:hypothetical protein